MVFADEALSTKADVMTYVKDTGIAETATRDGLCILCKSGQGMG